MSKEVRKRKKAKPEQTDPKESPTPTTTEQPKKTSSCGLCCKIFVILVVAVIVYLYLIPCPIDPVAIQISEVPPEIPGAEITKLITSPDILKLRGAECFVVHEATGYVYTGLVNGAIARFKLDLTGAEFLLRTSMCMLRNYHSISY